MSDDLIFFNGLNGATGGYDLPPMTGLELAGFIRGERPPENLAELRYRYELSVQRHLGLRLKASTRCVSRRPAGA